MSSKALMLSFTAVMITAALCLGGCASGDMKSMDNSTQQKTLMKDSGKPMNEDMDKHQDMGGSM